MRYIVQRRNRYCVVAYDGHDPFAGRERRRWHPIGHDSHKAEQLAARLDRERNAAPAAPPVGPTALGGYLTATGMPHKRRQVRSTTAYRYAWFVERYIQPTSATSRCDGCVPTISTGSTTTSASPPVATEPGSPRRLCSRFTPSSEPHSTTPAKEPRRPQRCHRTRSRRRPAASSVARSWTVDELAAFLDAAWTRRRHPACASLCTPACDTARSSGSSGTTSASPAPDCRYHARCRTSAGGPPSSVSRRAPVAAAWNSTVARWTNCGGGDASWNVTGCRAGPMTGVLQYHWPGPQPRVDQPALRTHRPTERPAAHHQVPRLAPHPRSLLGAAGASIKVVTERLGHAHPALTMATYQHLVPGMSSAAAERFATMVADAGR